MWHDLILAVSSHTLIRVFAEQLLELFKAYPNLVVDFHRDLREHLSNLRTLATGGEPLYLHLVSGRGREDPVWSNQCRGAGFVFFNLQAWAVGTYTHICYNPQCTSNITLEFFEVRTDSQKIFTHTHTHTHTLTHII